MKWRPEVGESDFNRASCDAVDDHYLKGYINQ